MDKGFAIYFGNKKVVFNVVTIVICVDLPVFAHTPC